MGVGLGGMGGDISLKNTQYYIDWKGFFERKTIHRAQMIRVDTSAFLQRPVLHVLIVHLLP